MNNIDHISYFDESNSEVREWANKLQGLRETMNNEDVSETFLDIVESHSIALGEEILNRMYIGRW